MLSVQVWDSNLTKSVEKAIRDSGLGLNPMAEGSLIRVPVPELNEDAGSSWPGSPENTLSPHVWLFEMFAATGWIR